MKKIIVIQKKGIMRKLVLILGLFTVSFSSLSQDTLITYTLDTTFSASYWEPYQIDIDRNGSFDYSIYSTIEPNGASDPNANYLIVICPLNGNEVAANPTPNSNSIIDFSQNDTILCNDIVWFSDPEPSPAFPIQWVFGESDDHFDTIVSHFIGIRLVDQGVEKTGWIKYTAYDGEKIHLKSVGYMESCTDIILDEIPNGFLDNTASHHEFSIFPNPANDYFTVNFINNKKSYLKVLDITGKDVYQKTFMNTAKVSSDKYKKGIYFINVVNGNNIITKIVIIE